MWCCVPLAPLLTIAEYYGVMLLLVLLLLAIIAGIIVAYISHQNRRNLAEVTSQYYDLNRSTNPEYKMFTGNIAQKK